MHFTLLADRPNDIPTIARWYYDQWGRKRPDNSYEKTCQRLRNNLNRDRLPLHLLAIDHNQPLAAAALKIREMDIYPDREHWLGNVYVHPAHRNRGIATNLVIHITDLARNLAIPHLSLQTERQDGGLYSRLGWHPVERVHYKGAQVTVMERYL